MATKLTRAGLGPDSEPHFRRRPPWRRRARELLTVSDAIVILGALLVTDALQLGASRLAVGSITVPYWLVSVLIGVVWLLALGSTHSRSARVLIAGVGEYKAVLDATFFTFGLVAITAYLLQAPVSRGYFLKALPVGLLLLLISRWLWRKYFISQRRRGRFADRTIVVGRHADLRHLERSLGRAGTPPVRPVAIVYLDPADTGPVPFADAGLEEVAYRQLADRAKHSDVDTVVLAGDLPGGRTAIRRLGWELESSGVELVIVSRLTDVAGPRVHMSHVEGLPLVYVSLPRFTGSAHAAKRVIDVVFSSLALVVLSPVFLVIAIAIRLDSPGPVFFRQTRIGARGRPFQILKFRTMVPDAEARKAALADQNEGAGPLFKLKNDPRVTRVGRVLRRTSLDELPQFVNVFLGQMSVVGPRPPLAEEVLTYDRDVARRLLIRPGITGQWQVSGRSDLTWEESVRLDLYYVENWSVTGDIAIIGKTVLMMFKSSGAY